MSTEEQAEEVAVDNEEKKSNGSISEYLQAPRKKRKNYVILALGEGFNKDLAHNIEKFIKGRYQGLAMSRPKNMVELKRQFNRNIALLVMDDEFGDINEVCESVENLKIKRSQDLIPVLFLTRQPDKLIDAYRAKLSAFHESDDYCLYNVSDPKQVLGRIKSGIESQNKRKSRRYRVQIDIDFYRLSDDKTFKGVINDLSVHGAVLRGFEIEIGRAHV